MNKKVLTIITLFLTLACLMSFFSGCGSKASAGSKGSAGKSMKAEDAYIIPEKSYSVSDEAEYSKTEPEMEGRSDMVDDVRDGEAEEEVPSKNEEVEETIIPDEKPIEPNQIQSLLTATAWNDNGHYEEWLSLFKSSQESKEPYFNQFMNHTWGLNSTQRLTVKVTSGDRPVSGAFISCEDKLGVGRFKAVTGSDGVAYLFPEIDAGRVIVNYDGRTYEKEFSKDTGKELEFNIESGNSQIKSEGIRLMFVVDVTGSMGDELSYLKAELGLVISEIARLNANVPVSLSVLFYRDEGDSEKFNFVDFVSVTNKKDFNALIGKVKGEYASGGGDYEEAVDEALLMAAEADWGNGRETCLIFHFFDAPAHTNMGSQDQYEQRFEKAVRTCASKGIRICPVLCSGADMVCEYTGRQAAVYTGGTSIFVTDDSGIGGSHYEAKTSEKVVEYLTPLIVRLIDGYYTGTFRAPVPIAQQQ